MSNVLYNAYQLRIFYTNGSIQHRMNLYLEPSNFAAAPGLGLNQYTILDEQNNSTDVETWADVFVPLLAAYLKSPAVVDNVELWKIPSGQSNGTFLSAKSYGTVGTNAAGNDPTAIEGIHTARTNLGRIFKLHVEEANFAVGAPTTWISNPSGTFIEQMGAEVLAPLTFVRDRENGHPIALMRVSVGTNEAIFKKRFRDT